jgi:hypothetical protein
MMLWAALIIEAIIGNYADMGILLGIQVKRRCDPACLLFCFSLQISLPDILTRDPTVHQCCYLILRNDQGGRCRCSAQEIFEAESYSEA